MMRYRKGDGERSSLFTRRSLLLGGALTLCERYKASSFHVNFPTRDEWDWMGAQGMARREGQQYHWRNDGYADFALEKLGNHRAGGSLRAGVTENPVRLTRSVRDALTKVTLGGVPAYVWPGGGITLMVDVTKMPEKSFGYVPTPALVAPIEFTLRADDYAALGGYASRAVSLQDVLRSNKVRLDR